MTNSIYTSLILLAIYDKEINQHYLKRYIRFIKHFKAIEPSGKRKTGFERHHIFPNNKCSEKFGNDPNNLVLLPLRVHFIAHWLLWKVFPKNQEMMLAFRGFVYGHGKERKNLKITSRVFEKLKMDYTSNNYAQTEIGRKKCSETALNQMKNGNHPSQIKKYCQYCNREFDSPNYSLWHGEKCLENPLNYGKKRIGKPHTEESKRKQSESRTGINHTEESKRKLSEAAKKRTKIKCEHCGKEAIAGNYSRWHGDKCLKNPNTPPRLKKPPKTKQIKIRTNSNDIKVSCIHCHKVISLPNLNNGHGDFCKMNKNAKPFFKKPQSKIFCSVCSKLISAGNYKRYHGDKCKYIPISQKVKKTKSCEHCGKEMDLRNLVRWHGLKCPVFKKLKEQLWNQWYSEFVETGKI